MLPRKHVMFRSKKMKRVQFEYVNDVVEIQPLPLPPTSPILIKRKQKKFEPINLRACNNVSKGRYVFRECGIIGWKPLKSKIDFYIYPICTLFCEKIIKIPWKNSKESRHRYYRRESQE